MTNAQLHESLESATTEGSEELAEELVLEEVSIDGMCGVY